MLTKVEGIGHLPVASGALGVAFAVLMGCPARQEPRKVAGQVPEQRMVLASALSSSHEPAGFTPRWPTWDGTTLPITPGGCANPNRFGMCGWAAQTTTLTAERDANGPFMRTLFPGRTSPAQ